MTNDTTFTDERDGTREVLVPNSDGTGSCYHVRGGCGGHRLTSTEATAEELVTFRGLRPCAAKGCQSVGVPEYDRCDGCGKPIFDAADDERAGTVAYCAACDGYLEENPHEHGHEHYGLREPSHRFAGTVVMSYDDGTLVLDDGDRAVSVPGEGGPWKLGEQVEVVGHVREDGDSYRIEAEQVREVKKA